MYIIMDMEQKIHHLKGGCYFMKYAINVYGRDVVCASCVNAPGSKDTYEWLEAVLSRKYPDHELKFNYIDIDHEENLSIVKVPYWTGVIGLPPFSTSMMLLTQRFIMLLCLSMPMNG